jgi:hypothetical protein
MSQAADSDDAPEWFDELHELGTSVGQRLQETPAAGRRAFLGGLASVIGLQALSDIVAAQDAQPGAACTWLGDQDATGYGLYNLGELQFADGSTLSSASNGSGVVNQVATGTVTATGGASPAVETHLDGVSGDQLVDYWLVVYVDADPAFDADYAFNFDYIHQWDDDAGQLDLDLVVNWDIDPGSGNDVTLRWEVLH